MNTDTPYGPRDESSRLDGDGVFTGVDEELAPHQLASGYVCRARNARFRGGRVATRGGWLLCPWLKNNGRTPFASTLGGAVFNDPAGSGEWILIAAEGGVWKTRPNNTATPVPLPAGVTLTAGTFAKFIQANAAIVLLRGLNAAPLVCTALDEGFKPIAQVNTWAVTADPVTNRLNLPQHNLLIGDPVRFTGTLPSGLVALTTYYVLEIPTADDFTVSATSGGTVAILSDAGADVVVEVLDGAQPIPNAVDGIFHLNRLILVDGRDTVVASDIGDFTRYQPATSQFRINEGDSDALVAVYAFNEDTIIFIKQLSVYKVEGVSGDLGDARGPLHVTRNFGGVAARGVADTGADLYWLTSDLNVMSLQLTALNQSQGTNRSLSDKLTKTFARIKRNAAGAAQFATHDRFLFCALPLDDARVLGDELVAAGQFYVGASAVVVSGLTIGQKYTYDQGVNDYRLHNGSEVLDGPSDFIAQDTVVELFASEDNLTTLECTASLKPALYEDVCNGIAVYDFQNEAWAGSDEAERVTLVRQFLKFTVNGSKQLGYLSVDGWLRVYDADAFEDERLLPVATPYVDVLVDTKPAAGNTLQINGGVIPAGVNQPANNFPLDWGVTNFDLPTSATVARQNLWGSTGVGYDQSLPGAWTCPNCTAQQIGNGVRFLATNGVLPVVKVNGVIVANGVSAWAFVDSHSGDEIQGQDIVLEIDSRGYPCQNPDFKKYLALALQLAWWAPLYDLSTRVQGIATDHAYAADQSRDRTKYFSPHAHADWDPSNAGDDHATPFREDYSTTDNTTGLNLGSGVGVDDHQEGVHRLDVSERGLYMQALIVNRQGRLELATAFMEANKGEVVGGVNVN